MTVVASILAVTVSVSVVAEVPALAAPSQTGGTGPSAKSVPVAGLKAKAPTRAQSDVAALTSIGRTTLPGGGAGDVPVSGTAVAVGGLPVTLNSVAASGSDALRPGSAAPAQDAAQPASVRVTVAAPMLAKDTGVRGVVLGLTRSDKGTSAGRVHLRLDYSQFANAYGANYGSRLHLVALPACALTTPDKRECQQQSPLPSVNVPTAMTLSADVDTAPDPAAPAAVASSGRTMSAQSAQTTSTAVVAATSTSTSSNGNFTATSLSPAYSWAAGNQGGTFTYSYPFKMPASLGGPAPQLALSYDSGSVDGKTLAQNGQPSWVGEGWDLEPGYIERSYRPCNQDGGTTADLCWFSTYNATMVFGGKATQLVRDNSSGVWHAADDSGLKIENLTGTSNWTYNGEYWRVTTQDGTQYYFGKGKRYAGDTADTAATLPEPVFGNNPGEPCYNSAGFASSWCEMGYRWNLDYVVDPRGNSMTYFYANNQQYVGINNNTNVQPYLTGSHVDHIEYGTRAGSEASTTAPMRVLFGTTVRCLDSPTTPCSGNPQYWPDTPWDLNCYSSPAPTSCPNLKTPAYWTQYRLTSVTTQVLTGSAYRNVDRWDLTHIFPDPGDGTSANLWLQTITHTGYTPDDSSQSEPTLSFGGNPMANRKNYGSDIGVAPYNHYRINLVRTGSGGETDVSYASSDCARGWDPKPADNPHRCFPVYFTNASNQSGWDWFNKYIVTSVTNKDLTGGSPDETWSYAYSTENSSDAALWHHDYNETAQLTYRSWTQWQGYSTVTTTHGSAGGPQTVSTNVYYRGMDGDGLPSTDNLSMVWNARRAGLTTPLGNPGATGAVSNVGSKCLDIYYPNGTGNGTRVESWDCHNGWNQQWVLQPDGTLKNPTTGRCLDIYYPNGTGNGTPLELWDCNATWNQIWRMQPDGTLQNPTSGRCLDIADWNTANGANVQLWDCHGGWNQTWKAQADLTFASPQTSRCLDIYYPNGTGNGTKVESWTCNWGWNQQWILQADGTVKNPTSGRCLDIYYPNGTGNGAPVELWDCNATWNQIWQLQPDGTLRNPTSGRCLDAGSSPANGNQIMIWDCNASVTQRWVHSFNDSDGLQGFPQEQRTLDGSQLVASTIHTPTVTQTAVRSAPATGGQDLTAHMVTETTTRTRTWIATTNSWRWTETDTSYDSYGLPVDVKDLGDTSTAADDRCTHTDYATRDTTRWMIDYPKQTYTTDCAAGPTSSDYLTGTQYYYDGQTTWGNTPTQGLITTTNALVDAVGTPWNWKQTGRADYDSYGRPTATYDALDHKTTTVYTPASASPVTSVAVTNPMGWITTTQLDPGKTTPTSVVDVNGKTTTAQYDPLGRLTKVWRNNRPTSATPDLQYTYTLSDTAPNWVQTQKLGPAGQQISSFAIYDGLLRPRQTQTPAPQAVGGRVIADTSYDGRGLAVKTSTFWNNASGPTNALVAFNDADVANQHRYSYDNLERQTADALYSNNALKWQTITAYDGDRTTVTPPAGGTPTTTISNARGKTTTLRQYLSGTPSGSFQDTTYTYDRLSRQTGITDPAGNKWTTTYDLRGRVTQTTDPDKGTITSTYDNAGELLTTKDDRGVLLAYKYDSLGRKTELWQNAIGTGTKLADWTFDTLDSGTVVKGQPAKANRYNGGSTYSSIVTGYDDAYRPLGATVRIPAPETGLAGDWTTSTTYNVDGSPATVTYPAAAGLGAETVTTSYDNVGLPTTLAGLDTYVADTQYYYWGTVKQQLLGTAPKQVKLTTGIDEATGRLTQLSTSTQADATTFAEKLTENYTYNPAGQVTSIAETNAGNTVSNQCFTYDGLQQLTEAWTTTATTCQTTPTQATVGGPDPYWTSYRYDTIGNRTSDTTHDPAGDTTRTYTYPAAGAARPHAVTSAATTGATVSTNTYGYDNAGNTTSRTIAAKPGQTLTWDAEDHLATLTDTSGTTSYLYDASGNRLIAHDSTGTTLYLGATEVHRDAAGAISATRFYGSTAVRTDPGGLTWLAADNHATGELAINASDLTATRRKTDPFGNPRGTQPTWPTTHGYVNGITDPTGLTHLGAREYDPTIGRFISVDPILDAADPIQMNGYNYANNNPATGSDPSGLRFDNDVPGSYPGSGGHTSCGNNCPGPWNTPQPGNDGGSGFGGNPRPGDFSGGNYCHGCGAGNTKPKVIDVGPLVLPNTPQNRKMAALYNKAVDGSYSSVYDQVGLVANICESAFDGVCAEYATIMDLDFYLTNQQLPDIMIAEALTTGAAAGAGLITAGIKRLTMAEAQRLAVGEFNAGLMCKRNSFDKDTPVLMADGSMKPIKDVQVGDRVEAADPSSQSNDGEPVTHLHLNRDTDLADVTIADADGHRSVLHTTQNHPFWDVTTQQWTSAAQLQPGDLLHRADGGTARVTAVRSFDGLHDMYNLTVANLHTYYVMAGNTPVLVHNEGDEPISGTIARGPNGMTVQIYANDHGPPHAHLKGRGFDIQIGQNGKPLDPNVELNSRQQQFVDDNIGTIRNRIGAKMREFRLNGGGC